MKTLVFCLLLSVTAWSQPLVTFPNGGEMLVAGTTVSITWSGTSLNEVVGIDYTIDNWTSTVWLSTNYQNPNANSYSWVVPNTPGTQCKVGVFNTSFAGDISDDFFTIATSSVGMDDIPQVEGFDVAPNPVFDLFRMNNKTGNDLVCHLVDPFGRVVKTLTIKNNSELLLQRDQLESGCYLLQLFSSDDQLVATKRLLVN